MSGFIYLDEKLYLWFDVLLVLTLQREFLLSVGYFWSSEGGL